MFKAEWLMDTGLIINIIYNASLLLALFLVYTTIQTKTIKPTGVYKIVVGIVFGLVGVAIMFNPHKLEPGVFLDGRSVLIGITGMFMGAVPAAIVSAITIAYRIYTGGEGIVTGIAVILVSAAIGLIWHYVRYKKISAPRRPRILEFYIMGLIIHVCMLLCFFLLPSQTAVSALKTITIPVMLIFPAETAILGILLQRHYDRAGIMKDLEESEDRYRSLFENTHASMLLVRPDTREIADANPAACSFYGWTREEMKHMSMGDISMDSQSGADETEALKTMHQEGHLHFKHKLKSGQTRDVEVFGGRAVIKSEELYFIIVHDITNRRLEQRKLEESEEKFKVTLLSVGEGVITTDKEGIITLINETALKIVGYTEDAVGKPITSVLKLVNESTGTPVEDPVKRVIETGHAVELSNHTVLLSFDGEKKVIEDSAAPIKDDKDNLLGVVFVFKDVTEERVKQQQILYLSYHDSLTGLYNRSFFDEEQKRLDTNRNLPISVIVGDVNGLKLTNDAFGHETGDRLLKDMAEEIKKACRKEDIIARWGGDEFIILLPKTDERSAERICGRIRSNCANVTMSDVNFSISLGYDTKKDADVSLNAIVKSAERYMYRKKYIEKSSTRGRTVQMILLALHEKNPREQRHSKKVSMLCSEIGKAMGMPEREINELEVIGMMHDIGKIAISDSILNKKGTLSAKELSELKRHPEIGYRILSSSADMAYIAEYVLKHHERLDGGGYPQHIGADNIPIASRILAVADAYEAMTGNRPYKEEMSKARAIQELREHAGTQFDSNVVEIFVNKVLNDQKMEEKYFAQASDY